MRWGIMGTARIAAGNFLPGLRAAGNGEACAVASRSLDRAREFATKHDIPRALEGYDALLKDGQIDAVYISLPNDLHATWTIRALQSGKHVLCEKPLTMSVEETREVLRVGKETGKFLWEAFVFPFHPQMRRLRELLAAGAIGEPREVQSSFHFALHRTEDIRLSPERGGGALYDVGCYCIRLADLVFQIEPDRAVAMVTQTPTGVDATTQAVLNYPDRGRLLLSCSLRLPQDTMSTIIGDNGSIGMTNPFHPRPGDYLAVRNDGGESREPMGAAESSFAEALRQIDAAILGQEEPRHLAIDEALSVARGIQLVQRSTR